MSYRYQNKNVLFGRMTAGGPNGREITNGAKRVAKRENYGNGEMRELTIKSAAKELKASYRQGRRIAAYESGGDAALIHGNVGKESGRKTCETVRGAADAHIPPGNVNLPDILCREYERTVSNDYVVRFECRHFQILKSNRKLPRPRATLINLTLINVALCICSFHYANTTVK
jgi:hypothetical protein